MTEFVSGLGRQMGYPFLCPLVTVLLIRTEVPPDYPGRFNMIQINIEVLVRKPFRCVVVWLTNKGYEIAPTKQTIVVIVDT